MSGEAHRPEVLVVDDELQMRRLLRITLESAGYAFREASTASLGLSEAALKRPDLVILDLGLPDMPGLELLRRLREWTSIPVLILSVLGQESEKIAALDAGADDYLTKPFGSGELLARLRVLLRRQLPADELSVLRFGAIQVDLNARLVSRDGREVKLTAKEYSLLRFLLVHRGKVVTHSQLLRELWGPNATEQTHYLRVYMTRLRQKLEDDPGVPRHLRTEPGVGYRLVTE